MKPAARILVVEDDAAVRRIVSFILERDGCEVLASANGPEALAATAADPRPVDLVLADIVLPGMSGPALAATLTSGRPDLKVLFMSGYVPEEFVRGGEFDPKIDFLAKPFASWHLIHRVRQALGGIES